MVVGHQDRYGQTLESFRAATQYDRHWYKAWHAWALANFDIASQIEKAAEGEPVAPTVVDDHVVPAVHGKGPVRPSWRGACVSLGVSADRGWPRAVCRPSSRARASNDGAGFFRSISLSHGNSLQDTLRLLTLWFKYGHEATVDQAMTEGFGDVSIDTWLQVIPQVRAAGKKEEETGGGGEGSRGGR